MMWNKEKKLYLQDSLVLHYFVAFFNSYRVPREALKYRKNAVVWDPYLKNLTKIPIWNVSYVS